MTRRVPRSTAVAFYIASAMMGGVFAQLTPNSAIGVACCVAGVLLLAELVRL